MKWANFLHFYQPPTQKKFWIKKIAAEAYRPILLGLKKQPRNKVTLNVCGVLLELLETYGEQDIILLIKDLLEGDQIELTGSAKYHPLLPFLPKEEARRQIQLNEETLKKYFGALWHKKGFFPPEMGYDRSGAELVRELGYQWMIVDELSFPRELGRVDYSQVYQIAGLQDFHIYFRERKMSWIILSGQIGTGKLLIDSLGERLQKHEYLLTAMDGETFGHHRPGLERLLFEIHDSESLENILISDLPKYFTKSSVIEPIPSTWALMEKDLEEKKPFSRWKDPDNSIQSAQWELTDLAIETLHVAKKDSAGYQAARVLLDRALHSDQFWWASARPWWSIEMIERGAKELTRAILETPGVSQEAVGRAEELYQFIIFSAFDWQREGIVDNLSRQEDEDIRQRTDEGLPRLPREEVEKMIKVLEKEMAAVAKKQEFERAAQMRDRIAELRRYATDFGEPSFSKEGDKEWEA